MREINATIMSQKKSIALVGYRATGKTFLGRILSKELCVPFVDMDEELGKRLGMSIQEWVAAFGWESFRQAESRLLEELALKPPMVLATGGGVVLSESNRLTLGRHFLVIWLQASFETICRRLGDDPATSTQRPALTGLPKEEEIRSLLASRLPLYTQVAHFTLCSDVDPPSISIQRILDFVEGESLDGPREGFTTHQE